MATSSFTQSYKVKRNDANRLLDIIDNKKKLKITKVKGHTEVKGSAISKFLGLVK